CRDPWISRAVREVAGRTARGSGDAGECDLRLFGGRWGSYAELRAQVDTAFHALRDAGLEHTRDGSALRDLRFGGAPIPLERAYLGPREEAPRRNSSIRLARGYVMALDRRCPVEGCEGFSRGGAGERGSVVASSAPLPGVGEKQMKP
ncbi:MAG TPA: hypothetical protein VFI96_07975, partial [Longimicrobiaceae bacterium]|nr:hypothetical protein [Longimicrobiaceae bacterium]